MAISSVQDTDRQAAAVLYEPSPRFWHSAVAVKEKVYVRGGWTEKFEDEYEKKELASTIEEFDPHNETWRNLRVEGDPHGGLLEASCASFGGSVFTYGGHIVQRYCENVSKMDLVSQATPSNLPQVKDQACETKMNLGLDPFRSSLQKTSSASESQQLPMKKSGFGLVAIGGGRLAMFGGCGIPMNLQQKSVSDPQSKFIKDSSHSDGRGFTNEFHVLDINKTEGVWTSPALKGTRPPPCFAFSFTSIDEFRALSFGGFQPEPRRNVVSDLHLFDFKNMEVTKIERQEGEKWPEPRDFHAACCLGYGTEYAQLLISGGHGGGNKVLKDAWLFGVSSRCWKEVTLPDGVLPRWGHSTTTVTICSGLEEVVTYGGCFNFDLAQIAEMKKLANTTLLTFALLDSEYVLLRVVTNSLREAKRPKKEKESLVRQMLSNTPFETVANTDISSYFSCEDLLQLERAGIPVLRELASKSVENHVAAATYKWLLTPGVNDTKPIWKYLLLNLEVLDLKDLIENIKCHLGMLTDERSGKIHAEEIKDELITMYRQLSEKDEAVLIFKKKIEELISQAGGQTPSQSKPATVVPLTVADEVEDKAIESFQKGLMMKVDQLSSHLYKSIVSIQALEDEVKHAYSLDQYSDRIATMKAADQDLRDRVVGAEIVRETSLVVTKGSTVFNWEGMGLSISIRSGSLPEDVDQCTISIMASLSGQYEFPENSHLVSAIYWLYCEPKCRFQRQAVVSIQHCAKSENAHKLSFVRASCSQKRLPYTFHKLQGSFVKFTSFGVSALDSFSALAITQEGTDVREYCASLFIFDRTRNNTSNNVVDIHFVVTWNIKAHLRVTHRTYHRREPNEENHQTVMFVGDSICLDIPDEGITTPEGWEIIPSIRPIVTKKQVDSFKPGKMIPSCKLTAELKQKSDNGKVPKLKHRIQLVGAEEPFVMFNINYIPQVAKASQEPIEMGMSGPTRSDQKPELRELIRVLHPRVSGDWEYIGIELKINIGVLDEISRNNVGNVKDCLKDMLKIWLKQVNPSPSWQAIVDALEGVGRSDIAEDLRLRYMISSSSSLS